MTQRMHAGGFTLVELLFSMAVGTIILLAAASFLGASVDEYARVGNNLSDQRECRMLMGGISSEIRSAVFHEGMRIERNNTPWPTTHIGFLTLRPADAQSADHQIGDLCAVHYYIKDLTMEGRIVRCVMRGFRDSLDTFDALRGHAVDGLFLPREDADEPIALRVVSFDAIPLVMEDSGHWKDAPLPLLKVPEAFRIRLVIANPSLAAKLTTSADWDGSTTAARRLGNPADAEHNADLEVIESVFPFRHHDDR
jgi:prepilin-type N-terminal cleavage/methylation domain-containing protein